MERVRHGTPVKPTQALDCYCGAPMSARESRYGWYFVCTRAPACDGKVGCHSDGRPLGVPCDQATRAARISAHAAFDALWQNSTGRQRGKGARKSAYRWLQQTLKLSEQQAHIGCMSIEQCHALIAACEQRVDRERRDRGTSARARDSRHA